jgi:hypothetical protein
MAGVIFSSPSRSHVVSMDWHPSPLSPSTKKDLIDSFSHYENFSYDERKGGFVVEVPVPPGRGKVLRATPAVLSNHLELDVKLKRSGKRKANQPSRPLEECYSWWLGQLIHYGLPLELSTDEAKQSIKSTILLDELGVPDNLKKMEQRMRTANNRWIKTSANRSTPKPSQRNIKAESETSDSEGEVNVIRPPSSRKRRQIHPKVEIYATSDNESGNYTDSSNARSDCGVPNGLKRLAADKTQSRQTSRLDSITHKATLEKSREESSDSDDAEDISHDAVDTEEEQTSAESEGDSEEGDGTSLTVTKALPISHDSDDEITDGGSFSGNSEYERAVMSHSQAIHGASVRYGGTDTDSSSESSYDDEVELQTTLPSPAKKLEASEKPPNTSNSAPRTAQKSSVDQTDPVPSGNQSSKSKELKIKRDRKPRSEELETASVCETTPSRTPKKLKKRDPLQDQTTMLASPAATTTNVHSNMTYEDIGDPVTRHKIARMRSSFPNETIHLCFTCLAKHNFNYDEGCKELVKARLAATLNEAAQASVQGAQATPSSRKRKRSSIPKQAAIRLPSPAKYQDVFSLSDSDAPIIKKEPRSEQRMSSTIKKRASLISDHMHGLQIDLTTLDDSDSSVEVVSKPPQKKRGRKTIITPDKSTLKPLQAISGEVPWFSALKARTEEREKKKQLTFPSSPPISSAPKSILKSSPSFKGKHSLLSKALDSAGPPDSQHRTRSSDLEQLQRKVREPELSPHPPPRKMQSKPTPQHHVSFNDAYATNSRWQALNPDSKSKMQPGGQIEEEAKPETRRTLFPPANNRNVGLSREDGGGLLQRGIVRNPSTSNSTSTKKQRREKGF